MSGFQWNKKRSEAALQLAQGYTIEEAAKAIGVNERSIYRWKTDIEFTQEVDRLTHMVDVSNRAERLRKAMRVIRKKEDRTNKDLLEWLKYVQGETDGVKLDLTALFEAYTSMAEGRPDGVDEQEDKDTE